MWMELILDEMFRNLRANRPGPRSGPTGSHPEDGGRDPQDPRIIVIVLESSAMVDALVGDPANPELLALIADSDLHARSMLDYEAASALRGHVLGGKLSDRQLEDATEDFRDIRIERYPLSTMMRAVLDLLPASAASRPDLVVTNVSAKERQVQAGQKIQGKDTTRNRGAATAQPSQTRYVLSKDEKWNKGEVRLRDRKVPKLKRKRASVGKWKSVTVPAQTAAGKYHLLACADATKKVRESKEANNCKATIYRITVTATTGTRVPANDLRRVKVSAQALITQWTQRFPPAISKTETATVDLHGTGLLSFWEGKPDKLMVYWDGGTVHGTVKMDWQTQTSCPFYRHMADFAVGPDPVGVTSGRNLASGVNVFFANSGSSDEQYADESGWRFDHTFNKVGFEELTDCEGGRSSHPYTVTITMTGSGSSLGTSKPVVNYNRDLSIVTLKNHRQAIDFGHDSTLTMKLTPLD